MALRRDSQEAKVGASQSSISNLTFVIKVIIFSISIGALIIWSLGSLFAANTLMRGGGLPISITFLYGFPFLYLPYCLISCSKLLRGYTLIISGVLMHLALVLWMIATISNTGRTVFVVIALVMAILWILLCSGRILTEGAGAGH
ncbi:MAG TPA: hypothetical protein VE842_04940 [Pyrinomonadaceae bacterium]|jgi:dolichyl-phosphate-mannose--protein O-mannosyl transferase|nr:hypothetical protein [Pyrinomonadaceae bacterium]